MSKTDDASPGTNPEASLSLGHTSVHHDAHNHLVAHHFADREQQVESATLGMWVFLATEVLFIGAIFTAYFSYRLDPAYFEAFHAASENLYKSIGFINTLVLLTSSLTVVLCIRAAKMNQQKQVVLYLLATMALGAMFFGFKIIEYYLDYHEHLWPAAGANFSPADIFPGQDAKFYEHGKLFMRFYYCLTGLHAFHMLVGLGIFVWLLVKAVRGQFNSESHVPLEICGLYWHFVDLVWIFLFPLLYLVR